jgi:hypothetical protein
LGGDSIVVGSIMPMILFFFSKVAFVYHLGREKGLLILQIHCYINIGILHFNNDMPAGMQ